ncbi:MAG: hypothetical protein WC716_01665 [Chitinophagaceae bacterium]|jgi:hypothetical protein
MIFRKSGFVFALLASLVVLFSCSSKKTKPAVSFYYWRTELSLKKNEKAALKENQVSAIYLRCFDIVYDEKLKRAVPHAILRFRDTELVAQIVPVVFIKNQVFLELDSNGIDTLAEHTFLLLEQINQSQSISAKELQIDCDWTQKTSENYFHFLRLLKQKLGAKPRSFPAAKLSATIRLHQIKYAGLQGVPPVDKGVLMFYNMGKINGSPVSSVYDRNLSRSYLAALNKYPLPLDFALPVFAWGIHLRRGQVIELLNKMDSRDFANKNEFEANGKSRFIAKQSVFKNGFYFKAGDEIKVEEIEAQDFESMAEDLTEHYKRPIEQLIFYDLDSINISRYEKDIFKKVATDF